MLAMTSRMGVPPWWGRSGKHEALPRCKRFLLSLTHGEMRTEIVYTNNRHNPVGTAQKAGSFRILSWRQYSPNSVAFNGKEFVGLIYWETSLVDVNLGAAGSKDRNDVFETYSVHSLVAFLCAGSIFKQASLHINMATWHPEFQVYMKISQLEVYQIGGSSFPKSTNQRPEVTHFFDWLSTIMHPSLNQSHYWDALLWLAGYASHTYWRDQGSSL